MEKSPSWSRAHDWKSCRPLKGLEGSNPSFSAKGSLGTPVVPRLFRSLGERVSLWFPLSAGNALDERLHPLCAVSFHLVRYMAIDIQRKGGGSVAEITLDGFNIIPAFDCGNGVAMAKIMEASFGRAYAFYQPLEILIDGIRSQVSAQLIGKHQTTVIPSRPRSELPLRLLAPLAAKQIHHERGGCDFAGPAAFGRG